MKKRSTLALVFFLALSMCLPALAYDGEIITMTADSTADPFAWDAETDPMAAWIVENFGLVMNQSETNFYANDFAVSQLAAVDGALPDVFGADILYYPQWITQMIPEELVAEIPQELIDKYPLTKALLENDEVAQIVYNMYGGHYFLPKPDSADPTLYKGERKGLYVRKDWLEAVGMEKPTSWEELYDVAHAFTHNDPDGNGKDDTYALTGDGMGTLLYFFASTGVNNRYWNKAEDGTWFFGALDDRNIEPLTWLRKMYDDGSIDPDFGAATWQDGLAKFASNSFGFLLRNADAEWINNVMVKYYGAGNPGVNPFDRIDVIGALANEKGGTPHMEAYVSCMVATMFSPDISEEAMDRFLSFYEYLLSDEGKYMRMGFEGEDWERDADGTIKWIRDENGNAPVLATKYPCIPVTHWPSWGFELAAYENVEYFDEYNDETKAMSIEVSAVRNNEPVASHAETKLIDDIAVTDLQAFDFKPEYWAIISGDKPVEEMFADMKARAIESGYGEGAEVVQEYAEKFGW